MHIEHPERPSEPVFSDEQIEARIVQRRSTLVDWITTLDVADSLANNGESEDELARLERLLLPGHATG